MRKTIRQAATDDLVPSTAKDVDLIDSKHQQIVNGACRILFKKGYYRTTIREIALACGMSMGQLYHYISKDDALPDLQADADAQANTWSNQEEIQNPLERLTNAVR
jgi:AcrR family transcriptional regulator